MKFLSQSLSFSLLLLLTLIPSIQAEPLAFNSNQVSNGAPIKIAIIGSGPSGASAAYFLSKANQLLSTSNIEITVFEKEERIGGRTAIVYPYEDDSYDPVELGASIFADVNRNLKRAVKVSLSRIMKWSEDSEELMTADYQVGSWIW